MWSRLRVKCRLTGGWSRHLCTPFAAAQSGLPHHATELQDTVPGIRRPQGKVHVFAPCSHWRSVPGAIWCALGWRCAGVWQRERDAFGPRCECDVLDLDSVARISRTRGVGMSVVKFSRRRTANLSMHALNYHHIHMTIPSENWPRGLHSSFDKATRSTCGGCFRLSFPGFLTVVHVHTQLVCVSDCSAQSLTQPTRAIARVVEEICFWVLTYEILTARLDVQRYWRQRPSKPQKKRRSVGIKFVFV